MRQFTALDLYCGAGYGALGLIWAGFRVTGIDFRVFRHYPGNFIQWDITKGLPVNIMDYDFVIASPPCQRHSISTRARGNDWTKHPELVKPTLQLLEPHPVWCVENVPNAPLRADITLTGPSVGLHTLQRKRTFQLSLPLAMSHHILMHPPPSLVPTHLFKTGKAITVTTSMCSNSHFYPRKELGKPGRPTLIETRHCMGIPICFGHAREKTERDKTAQYRAIGEGIAPPMMYHIGMRVKAYLEEQCNNSS